LGNPERELRCVHVAGTNGKGSTCRYLHRILQGAGMRTGMFTSPHIVCVRERFVIGENAIGEDAFADLHEEVRPHAELSGATYFEFLTAMAALWYSRNGADVLVLETGLGGRLDSTTAFPAEVCVVSQVGLDHMSLLGDTVEKIWAEKIAILRWGRPLVTLESRPQLMDALDRLAVERNGRVVRPDPARAAFFPGMPAAVSQSANLLLARVAAETLLGRDVVDDEIRSMISSLRWPGRMEVVQGEPDVILDVGHNPDAARELARSLGGRRAVLLYGTMADKNWQEVLSILSPLVDGVHLGPLATARAASPAVLGSACPAALVHGSLADAFASAEAQARKLGLPLVVFGSFHLVGGILRQMYSQGRYEFWPQGIIPDPEIPGMG
jgi:dihydrofolate synthase / folylpolyglutamate synthase